MIETDALRNKILELAVQGKLVPQDSNDELASVLLDRIREEKQRLYAEGKLKKKDIAKDSVIFKGDDNSYYEKYNDGTQNCIDDEIPYDIPNNWEWRRLNTIVDVRDGTHDTPQYVEEGVPLFTSKNLGENGLDYSNVKYISYEDSKKINERSGVDIGDILFAMIGTIGNPVMVDKDIEIDEPGIIVKWPDGEVKSGTVREHISDDEIRADVDTLKRMLSKYKKPEQIPVPIKIDETEMVYVEALYAAYASAEEVSKYTRRDVDRNKRYKKDFAYQRKCYYATETIRRSLQDALLPIEYKEFDEMRDEIKEGIYPKLIPPYDNGYLRLLAVTGQASLVPITRSQIALLPGWIGAAEKVGMCHMLANRKEIQWVDEDE